MLQFKQEITEKTIEITHDDWFSIQGSFVFLKSKSGIWIDPYTTLKLSPNHSKTLSDSIAQSESVLNERIARLQKILLTSYAENKWIYVDGD